MAGDGMRLSENLEMAGARIVFIVSRTEPYLYGYIRSAFAEVQAVEVILDRRQRERRQGILPRQGAHVKAVRHRLLGPRGGAPPARRSTEQAAARPYRGSDPRVAGGRTDRSADGRADGGPDHSAAHRALRRGPLPRRSSPLRGPLAADYVIGLKLLEALPAPRKNHHARTRGHRGAGRQKHSSDDE